MTVEEKKKGNPQWALCSQRECFLIVEWLGGGRRDKFRICLKGWEKEKYEREEKQRVLL